MDTLEYLHTIWMIVCVQWVAGHATERGPFGAVVAALTEIHNARQALGKRRRNDEISD